MLQWHDDPCERMASKIDVVQAEIDQELWVIVLRTGWSRDLIFQKIRYETRHISTESEGLPDQSVSAEDETQGSTPRDWRDYLF